MSNYFLFSPSTIEVDNRLCFVVMPFSDDFTEIFEDAIRPATEAAGFRCQRADDFFTPKPIISDVWESINASKVIVADVTGKNANVFYEIGLAHALFKPVVLLTQRKEDLPFDIAHIRAIFYSTTGRGLKELKKNIIKALKPLSERRPKVCIAGSGDSKKLRSLCIPLGEELIKAGYNIISGVGGSKDAGKYVSLGAFEYLEQLNEPTSNRIAFYFREKKQASSREQPSFGEIKRYGISPEAWREAMIKDCDVIIFIGGGAGTLDEYKLAQREKKFCLAIGALGGTGEEVLKEISQTAQYRGRVSTEEFELLNNPQATPREIVNCLITVLARLVSV